MTQAVSLHIGINNFDANHYGITAPLTACVNDAYAMRDIAKARGFKPTVLIDQQATYNAITGFLLKQGRDLGPGDTLFVTFAGHGSQTPDLNNDERPRTLDQTWCAYDRMIVDDELAEIWMTYRRGVRVLVVTDSCHNASVARSLELLSAIAPAQRSRDFMASRRGLPPLIGDVVGGQTIQGYRALPPENRAFVQANYRDLYAAVQRETLGGERAKYKATVLTLSACRDEEVAADGDTHGLYTTKLLDVWNEGAFAGNYRQFQDQIATAVSSAATLASQVQNPQYVIYGEPNDAFEAEQPFSGGSVPPTGVITKSSMTVYPPISSNGDNDNDGSSRVKLTIPPALVTSLIANREVLISFSES